MTSDLPQVTWSGRLTRLRAPEPTDWEAFHHWEADAEAERLAGHLRLPRSAEAARRWTEDRATRSPADGDVEGFWAVETLAGGELVGSIATRDVDQRHGTFTYGVAIGRQHWRRGFASDAVAVMLRYFFLELRFQKVNATVWAFNEASIAFHRKAGFSEEGRIRRNIYAGGRYHDVLWYGMTAREFVERYLPGTDLRAVRPVRAPAP